MYLMLDFFMLLIMIIPWHLSKLHPLFLSMLLTLYTMFLSLKLNSLNNFYWYSYILFLIMVGGILILFLYLTSISNNELMNLNKKYFIYFLLKFILKMMIFFILMKFLNKLNFLISFNFIDLNNLLIYTNEFPIEYKNLYMNFNLNMNIYLILYLFYTMIVCVLICTKNSLPLRQMLMNYE